MEDPFASTTHHSGIKSRISPDDDVDFCTIDDIDLDDISEDTHEEEYTANFLSDIDFSTIDDIHLDGISDDTDEEEYEDRHRKEARKAAADEFRGDYIYGRGMDKKTIVWDGRTLSLTDKSSGIVWVGVHGMNSICVVTRIGDLDETRLLKYLKQLSVELILGRFRRTVISELEDLAMPSEKLLRQMLGQCIRKPFGVVSVILDSDTVHKASSHEASNAEYDVTEATKFLMEKMEASTVDETVKTAISAFQILFQNKKFKAEDIGVSIMDPDYFVPAKESNYKDIYVKHLEMSDIREYLAAINEHGSRSSSSEASRSLGSSSKASRRRGPSTHYIME